MQYFSFLMRSAGISALLIATPALAQSRIDRARTAVTEASAKVEAAQTAGAATYAPDTMGRAQEALRGARDQLAHDNRDSTISEAHRASGLADQALAESERNKATRASAERDARLSAEATANAATADAAIERNQRVVAEGAAITAQGNAAEAQRAASNAEAEASAARIAAATPPTTTVTVDRTTTSGPAVKKTTTVRKVAPKAATPASSTTTTTTVKTEPR
ncbi:hypothetical protein [Sphingomonas sp. dw_22]|uniref:hypothetical protein n=1 Tax=Sphingomonas sp. dw_22 TaxID=2721175 RepID=UPI001BD228D7|nr:hypothetical protein [Sphingomonas sp. dw_22]